MLQNYSKSLCIVKNIAHHNILVGESSFGFENLFYLLPRLPLDLLPFDALFYLFYFDN